jgi:hypothetical protein
VVADSDPFDEELDPDPHQDYVDPQYILNPDLVLDPGDRILQIIRMSFRVKSVKKISLDKFKQVQEDTVVCTTCRFQLY